MVASCQQTCYVKIELCDRQNILHFLEHFSILTFYITQNIFYNMFYNFNHNVHIYTLIILLICEISV